jgi:iduronate 2-sulfatase
MEWKEIKSHVGGVFLWSFVLCIPWKLQAGVDEQKPKKYNVLFIVSDDLNNDLACYGNSLVKTPHIDRIAKMGTVFRNAYCQFPLCGPSRASLLTGLRPDVTKVYDLKTNFRTTLPGAITLPQLFKNQHYYSGRVGTIFHYGVPGEIGTDGMDDPVSWDKVVNPKGRDKTDESLLTNLTPGHGLGSAFAYLAADGTDDEQTDGMIANEAVKLMEENKEEPFFLAVGFFRPHCPYIAPKKYFDMYPLESIPLVREIQNDLDDVPKAALFTVPPHYGLDEAERRQTQRAYYATVTFMDAQVGKLLDALDRLKLTDNTIIVFLSDHGYNLGEHGQWQKFSLFENSVKTPLIIAAPGMPKGNTSRRTVELLDIYPTLAELCGLEMPVSLQGKSLIPLLKKPESKWERPAFSEIHRGKVTGRSVRTQKWRYTEWDDGLSGTELYDHDIDPEEFTNLSLKPSYQNTVVQLKKLLQDSHSSGN